MWGANFLLFSWLACKSLKFPPTNFSTDVIGTMARDRIVTKITSKRHQKLFTKICTSENSPLYSREEGKNIDLVHLKSTYYAHKSTCGT